MHKVLPILFLVACSNENIIEKQQNQAPTVLIVSHGEGAVIQEGYVEQFRASVSDDDNEFEELQLSWHIGEELVCDWTTASSAGEASCEMIFTPDDNNVIVEVRDTQGAGARSEIAVSVLPTEVPVVEILSPSSADSYYADQLIEFSALVSDAEDDISDLSIRWSSSVDGELSLDTEPDTSGEISDATYLTEGEHYIELRVEDTTAKVTTESVVVEVRGDNNIPLCEITEPLDATAGQEGETVMFRGLVSDSDIPDNELEVEWSSDVDGVFGTNGATTSGEVSVAYGDLTVATHSVTLTVRDEVGAVCSDAIFYTVGTPPLITLESPLSGEIYNMDDNITFGATVSDAQEPATNLALVWVSDIDGTFSTQGASSDGSAQFIDNTLSPGEHTLTVTVTDSDGLYAQSLLAFRVNTPPLNPVVSISPDPANTNDSLTVVASGSTDIDGDTVTYSYEWYQNSTVTSFTGTSIASSETSFNDVWTVRVTPNDGYIDGDYTESSITISNSIPVISAVTIIPNNNVYNDSTVLCSATANDDDDGPLSPTYEWTVGTSNYSGDTLDLSSVSVMPTDVIICTASVTDSGLSTVSDSVSTTIDNRVPSITSVNITPSSAVLTDSVLACSATATDVDGENVTLSYEWMVGMTVLGSSDTLTLNSSIVQPADSVQCTATVNDGFGGSDTGISQVTVDNAAPVLTNVSITPDPAYNDDVLSCIETATDIDSQSLTTTYIWTNSTTGLAIGSSSTISLNSSIAAASDVINCDVIVTDGSGGTVSGNNNITLSNRTPSISAVTIVPSSNVYNDNTLTCSSTATDADNGSLNSSYEWTVGSSSYPGDTLDLSSVSVMPTDVIICTATVTDSGLSTDSDSVSITIDNRSPSVSSVNISPSSAVMTDSVLACSATATDADGEGVTSSYEWTVGMTVLGSSDTLNLTNSMVQPGDSVHCSATVNDGYGGTDIGSAQVTVENSAPVLSSVSITPDPAYNDDVLSCVETATDIDNQSLTTTYAWTNSTTGFVIGSSSTIALNSTIAGASDVIICDVIVTDGNGGTATGNSNISLINRAPNTPLVQLSPDPAYNDSTLLCTASGSDPDGDLVSFDYSWQVDGLMLSETSSTLTGAFSASNVVQCSVSASDGFASGSSGVDSITISNAAPAVDSLTLSPDPLYTNNDLIVTATTSDPDGDALTMSYEWTVNGSISQTGSSNILSNSVFSKGDVVVVSATANDGVSNSLSNSTSLTCQNTPPSSPTLNLSPNSPIEQVDDVVCTVSSSHTDLDGDAITYLFDWTVNGQVFNGASNGSISSTVAFTQTTAGDVWACNVTPYDGNDYGSSSSSSVLIDADIETGEETFVYTGSTQYFTVPNSVTSIDVEAYGAQGGDGIVGSGGLGGYVMATSVPVQSGTTYEVIVGGIGANGNGGSGGWNGGASGGGGSSCGSYGGGGGGGASDVRTYGGGLYTRLVVAAGGGGGGADGMNSSALYGGGGGGTQGEGGQISVGWDGVVGSTCNASGTAGNQSNGGAAGQWACSSCNASAGAFGIGGIGNTSSGCGGCSGGGGGGGGWYGGGGGGHGGGGGGSSYAVSTAGSTSYGIGARAGDGEITISW